MLLYGLEEEQNPTFSCLIFGCAALSLRQAGAALTVMVYLVAEQGLSRAQASAVAP